MCSPDPNTNSAEPSVTNRKCVLSERPNGVFNPDKDAKLVTEPIPLKCKEDEIIVETSMLSIDAFIRTMLDEDAYHGSIPINSIMPAIGYGTRSRSAASFLA
jgi:NADPH-dependent curcumin reductase CurA